ncbi:keywimysin-related RiPP [Streptomyces sp. G45]
MRTYERPTLARSGDFRKVTGAGSRGPKDLLGRKQLL